MVSTVIAVVAQASARDVDSSSGGGRRLNVPRLERLKPLSWRPPSSFRSPLVSFQTRPRSTKEIVPLIPGYLPEAT
jgi:hypothetical protein